jgi:hypothetical protein
MTTEPTPQKRAVPTSNAHSTFKLSLDTWAVALSLALSLLVWLGVIKHIPW